MEAFMRAHHVIAVVAVLVIGFGAKQYFFPPMKAEADVNPSIRACVQLSRIIAAANCTPARKFLASLS
jgi:hypothetical protein